MTLPAAPALVLAEALKDAEREYRDAQQGDDPDRFAKAKARLEALTAAAALGTQVKADA